MNPDIVAKQDELIEYLMKRPGISHTHIEQDGSDTCLLEVEFTHPKTGKKYEIKQRMTIVLLTEGYLPVIAERFYDQFVTQIKDAENLT